MQSSKLAFHEKSIHAIGKLSSCSLSCVEVRQYTAFSLNFTIRSHLSSGNPIKALTHFLESQKRGTRPDRFTVPSLLKLSLELEEPPLHGEQIHAFAIKSGFMFDLYVSTGLIEMYFKYGYFHAPYKLFDEMPKRDVVSFTAMIGGLSQNWFGSQAVDCFFKMMEEKIRPTRITITSVLAACSQLAEIRVGRILHGFALRYGLLDNEDMILQTAFLDMYGKCGNLICANRIFDRMRKRNLVSWNSIINTSVSNRLFEAALQLFRDMVLEGWQHPKPSTLAAVLSVCGLTNDLRKGKEIQGFILKCTNKHSELETLGLYNAIIDMYVKTGNIKSSITIFDSMSTRNVVTWTTMISGYGSHGFSRKALHMFTQMKESGIKPDGIAFVSILSACSHGGLVDEGRELFHSMERDYNIVPGMMHFVCMVDLYGRAGRLEEAHEFIKKMPIAPSKFVWGALLSSCRTHKNLELGEYAARKALELDQYDVGNYVLLSRLYAEAGKWEDLSRVRSVMQDLRLKPDTACSWVEVKKKVYKFTVGDHLRTFSKDIYDFLDKLGLMMQRAGVVPDTSNVGHRVSEKQKMTDLCGHTEKLALAFVFIQCGGERVIRIGKNLRVCRDCHKVFKFVSLNYDKEIILKDPNRYHHFVQGHCSCDDFW
ncbi:pentatricopeptide repeat-containing protein At3g49170, chloroplastic-like [Typha latifolia]|uniref:pentatricopeptide repeat-containing protein At3g49170, chloroplastic-like n=1 Tax=Typha latifolia TaxID=4733 RepID=UPI003C2C1EB4